MSITDHSSSPISEGGDLQPPLGRPSGRTSPAGCGSRRLRAVFFDLGLQDVLPADWVLPCPEGLTFGDLDLERAARLCSSLEVISTGRSAECLHVGPGQLTLFGGGAK